MRIKDVTRTVQAAAMTAALAAVVMTGCATAGAQTVDPAATQTAVVRESSERVPRRPRVAQLSPQEMALARAAWKYFENNYQPATGWVNAADKYPSTTMWDLGSTFAATVSAHELGLITREEFDRRMRAGLTSLSKIELFRGELPNKAYHAGTLAATTYTNQPGEIGYSAIDMGRLMTWLRIIRGRYPEYADLTDAAVLRWNFCNVLDQWGTMFGTAVGSDKRVLFLQEGRLGYEEYAAKGFELWGFDTTRAAKPEPFDYVKIYGYDIPYDKRDPRELGAHNYVVSESYVLDGIEFNWDLPGDVSSTDDVHTDRFLAMHADRILLVQKARHRETKILTARTEHQLEGAPYFVYDTIYTDGAAWNTITEPGEVVPKFAAVAAKAAVGLWALWSDPYGDLLFQRVQGLVDPERGIYEGDYEDGRGPIKAFTANNNGIILETLLYRKVGKLLTNARHSGKWEAALQNERECTTCRPRRSAGEAGAARR
jgi:hypothetical protein